MNGSNGVSGIRYLARLFAFFMIIRMMVKLWRQGKYLAFFVALASPIILVVSLLCIAMAAVLVNNGFFTLFAVLLAFILLFASPVILTVFLTSKTQQN